MFLALILTLSSLAAALTYVLIAAEVRRAVARLDHDLDGAEHSIAICSPTVGALFTLLFPIALPFVLLQARGLRGFLEGYAIFVGLFGMPALLALVSSIAHA